MKLKPKFKVGDIVVVISNNDYGITKPGSYDRVNDVYANFDYCYYIIGFYYVKNPTNYQNLGLWSIPEDHLDYYDDYILDRKLGEL